MSVADLRARVAEDLERAIEAGEYRELRALARTLREFADRADKGAALVLKDRLPTMEWSPWLTTAKEIEAALDSAIETGLVVQVRLQKLYSSPFSLRSKMASGTVSVDLPEGAWLIWSGCSAARVQLGHEPLEGYYIPRVVACRTEARP